MAEQTKKGLDKKWISFGALMLGAGTIYKLGFMKDAFYVPMQEFMGLSHTQIGGAVSIAGWISTFGFLAAILVVDRISKKIMIPASLAGICLCGLWLSTFPSYPVFLLIYCLLAVFADMLYWPTMLKTVRLLGNKDEQGRMFGILEAGLRAAILFYAIVPGVIAIIAYFLLEPDKAQEKESVEKEHTKEKTSEGTIMRALKNKNIWLASLDVFFVYSVYCGLTYFIPFLSEAYAIPAVLVGVYGVINQYGLKMLGGPIGGFVTDKILHSATKYLRICFVLVAAALVLFSLLPHQQMGVILGMVVTLTISAFVFSMRAVFFAPMDEVNVPRDITGSAMSIGSFVGYLPGAFMYAVYGAILDHYEGLAGYRIVFITMAVFAVIDFFLSTYILKVIKKENANKA